MGRQRTQLLNPVEEVRKNQQALKETFQELARIYKVEDPNLMWVLYALLETDNFKLTRGQVEGLYSALAKWGVLSEEEGKRAVYRLFEAPFKEYHVYGGLLFSVADNFKEPKKATVFLNETVIIDMTFKMFLGRVALSLSKALSRVVQ